MSGTRWEIPMREAIAEAVAGRDAGEAPFGCVLLDAADRVRWRRHDTAVRDGDATSHAETMVVKEACAETGPDLAGHTLVTTTEPCPMCFTSAWLAGIRRIVFGCSMAEAVRAAAGSGVTLREFTLPPAEINGRGGDPVELVGEVLQADCVALFSEATGGNR